MWKGVHYLEFLQEQLLIFGRIITILPLLLLMTLFMGKRAIGELPIFDFLIIVILGAIVGADIADPSIHHLPTAIAIVAVAIFQRLIARWKIANRKVGRLLTFEPTVVIQDGKFIDKHMKKERYSMDNILQMLREKDVFDINEVETAIIEPNGALSVLKKPEKNTVTREDMNIQKPTSTFALPVIIEGTVYRDVLAELQLDEAWLRQQLANHGVHELHKVFFASINKQKEVHFSLKDENSVAIPMLRH